MKKSISFWVAVSAAIIAVIIRVYQLATAIDFTTGFYYGDSGITKYILYILFAVAIVAAVLGCIFDKKKGLNLFTKSADDFSPSQTLALGLAVLFGAVMSILEVVMSFDGKITLGIIGGTAVGIIYLIIAFLILSNKRIKRTSGFLMAFIAISYTVKSAGLFISDTVVTRVSEELLMLLTYIAAVFFFLACGRFFSRNEAKFSRPKLVFCTVALVVLSAASTLSKLVIYIIGPAEVAEQMSAVSLAEIGSFAVSLVVLVTLCSKKFKAIEEVSVEAEKTE